jgi:hypothetical protein
VILVATTTRDAITAGTTGDLIRLLRRHPDAKFMAAIGIYISNLRQQCASVALQTGASHLLFIDADMRFPANTLDRLLAHDLELVAANYVQRTMPEWWTARLEGHSVSSVGQTGLQAVDSVGCGVMLIRASVFGKIPRPWFDTPYDGVQHLGEDLTFCRHAQAHGIPVWVDHDLSQEGRHQGTLEWGVQTVTSCIPPNR